MKTSGRAAFWAVIGVAMLAAVPTGFLIMRTNTSDGADVATVLAFGLAVIATAVAVYMIRPRSLTTDVGYLTDQAGILASAITTAEARALTQLMGDTGDPRPANLAYAQIEASQVNWRSDGGTATGSLATVADYYRTLTRGRLVVLGEAGSGKTVVVLRLLLDLASARQAQAANSFPRVPVRLSLPSFRTSKTEPGAVREDLDKWIATHLVRAYNVRQPVADALVARGWLLPILDGLDEMDPGCDGPQRAKQVIEALNLPVGATPSPIVLTSRIGLYEQLTEHLQDATAIELLPLQVEQVATWLEHRIPHQSDLRRWRAVLSTIRARPQGRLAKCLSSPLHLYLALAVYRKPESTPRDLCELAEGELDRHLLAQLVPAITADRSPTDTRAYSAHDVERWLGTLAKLVTLPSGGRVADSLDLDVLWLREGSPPGQGARRRAAWVVAGLCAASWLVGTILMLVVQPPSLSPGYLVTSVLGLLIVMLNVKLATTASELRRPPRIDTRQLRSPRSWKAVRSALWRGAKIGPACGVGMFLGAAIGDPAISSDGYQVLTTIAAVLIAGLPMGLLGGLLVGLIAGLLGDVEVVHASAATPSEPHRQAVMAVAVVSLAFAVLLTTLGWMAGGVQLALIIFFMVAAPAALGASGAPRWWVQYLLFVRRKARTNDLPRDLPTFLDWAYNAGLLRLSGSSTQFRHHAIRTYFEAPGG